VNGDKKKEHAFLKKTIPVRPTTNFFERKKKRLHESIAIIK